MLTACLVVMPVLFGDVMVLNDPKKPAERFKDQNRHYSLKLVPGWVPFNKQALENANKFARERSPGGPFAPSITYEGGFHLQNQPATSFPYILTQWQSLPSSASGESWEDIEKSLGAADLKGIGEKVEAKLNDLVKNVQMGKPVLDRERGRIIMHMQTDSPLGKLQAFSVGYIGKEGILFLHCYDKALTYNATVGNFQAMVDSFEFEPGYAFEPGSGRKGIGGLSIPGVAPEVENAVNMGVAGAAVGLFVGGLVWIFQQMRRAGGGGSRQRYY
jgi:hypothetical protein